MPAKAIMVLGTTSGAGKSWLTTALCRWAAQQGIKVAPYKAQNMSNNARVVAGVDGALGEIGSAQYFQALAAKVQPEVRMNPILLKPERDTASQVVVMGQVRPDYASMPWRHRSELLWLHARQALHELMASHDLVIMEGAGSPAEINLHDSDYVNMRAAKEAKAQCLLVTDIDRGGAFAHLYGTHQLLPAHERALIQGFVLNRFRGDASLLAPGPQQLHDLTGVPTLAVLPMWRDHGLPEEDGLYDTGPTLPSGLHDQTRPIKRVAVIAYPHISNLDEFHALAQAPSVRLTWARQPKDLDGVDWVIMPGSKCTQADLLWVREQGLDHAIARHAEIDLPVLGICGGLQMLGATLSDPHGVDGCQLNMPGLNLLPLDTVFDQQKRLLAITATFSDRLPQAFAAWQGLSWSGYEIRHGRTSLQATASASIALHGHAGEAIGWHHGTVMGLYAHGLFESSTVIKALFGHETRTLDEVFDGLAHFIDQHFEPGVLQQWIKP